MVAQFNIGESIRYLQDLGVYEYILPFLLVFAIIFAILEKVGIFGADKTQINAVVAVVMGLLLIAEQSLVNILNMFLPNVAMVIVVILMFLLIASMISTHGSGELDGFVKFIKWASGIIGVIVLITMLAPQFNWRLSAYETEALITLAVFFALIGGIIYLVMPKRVVPPPAGRTPATPAAGTP